MSMPLSPTRLFVCTACGAVLPVSEDHIGKKCRCGRCGKVSLITEKSDAERVAQAKQSRAAEKPFGFFCRVCDTRLAARTKDEGRKAKCPDCGALTVVPQPPKSTPKKAPRAMHGQQYGVWGVDDAPNPRELKAHQPKFFPVYCRNCDTLMHARLEQVGKKMACPDCGAKTMIQEPAKPKPKKSPLVPDGQEYQLDASHVPPRRPAQQFIAPEAPKSEKSDSEPIRAERVARPKPPRLPTLQGIAAMLLRGPVVSWWLWLSCVAVMEVGLMSVVLGEAEGVMGLLMMLACYGMAFSLGAIWFSAASAIWLVVLAESSEGNDRVHHPPGINFTEWFGDMLYFLTSGMLALAPWWLICRGIEQDMTLAQQGILQAVGWLCTFPLLLLSCLENGSPLELFSPKIFSSITKLPGYWLLFFIQSAVVAGGCLLAVAGLLTADPRLAILAAPLCVGAGFVYFRILGRFAWWLAESLATTEE